MTGLPADLWSHRLRRLLRHQAETGHNPGVNRVTTQFNGGGGETSRNDSGQCQLTWKDVGDVP